MLIEATSLEIVVATFGSKPIVPEIVQSPAVNAMVVTSRPAPVESVISEPEGIVELIYSPMLPAFALSFVVVPTIPLVELGVIVPVTFNVPVSTELPVMAKVAAETDVATFKDCADTVEENVAAPDTVIALGMVCGVVPVKTRKLSIKSEN